MHIAIHASSDLPIYRQILRQIEEAILQGRLAPGEKLRSHRELAEQLVVAPLTVKKAYDELESLGYIETQRGRGTFVSAEPPGRTPLEQRERLKAAATTFLDLSRQAGLGLEDAVSILRQAHTEQIEKVEP